VGGLVALEALIWLVNIALDALIGQSVAAFSASNDCGSFAAYIAASDPRSRIHWKKLVDKPGHHGQTGWLSGPFTTMTHDHGRLSRPTIMDACHGKAERAERLSRRRVLQQGPPTPFRFSKKLNDLGDVGIRTRVLRDLSKASPSAACFVFLGPGDHAGNTPTGSVTV
jgi:hypothetical protein